MEEKEIVRFMIDTYGKPNGRLILAAGNNMTVDTPLASLEALLDEGVKYGKIKVKEFEGEEWS